MAGRAEGAPLCDYCYRSNPASFRNCRACDTKTRLLRGLCTPCTAAEYLSELFTAQLLRDSLEVQSLHAALLAADPARVVTAFQRTGSVELLRTLLNQEETRTHAFLDAAGPDQATRAVRSILVEHSLLPARDNNLARFKHWIVTAAQDIKDPAERQAFNQFARWRHLRELRQRPQPLSTNLVSSRRRELRIVIELLTWSAKRGRSLALLTQADIDEWLATGHGERHRVKAFLAWAQKNNNCQKLHIPRRQRTGLLVTGLDSRTRLKILEGLLEGNASAHPATAFAAAMTLLYGARPHQLTALQVTDILTRADDTYVRLGADPLLLPSRVGELARKVLLDRSAPRLFGTVSDAQWLFPGSRPGQPLTAAALIKRLRAAGVQPATARTGALGELAQDVPPVVLARLTGISVANAIRWSEAVSASNARYGSLGQLTSSSRS
ncbi:hypothetical protein [Pseudarthrobacter polychromogenes]|uniref:hypothetical protein n=1 Tax=Pseudarthrobacter polychromogenes TaxID=1676 RepID=UPI0016668A6F|nr:hypothetical protein [Pseudarthrobacter polychromogenes]